MSVLHNGSVVVEARKVSDVGAATAVGMPLSGQDEDGGRVWTVAYMMRKARSSEKIAAT